MPSQSGPPEDVWTGPEETHALSVQQPKAQEPYLDLVPPNDPDWQLFLQSDPAWFLKAAARAVRKYVGWHIYPNIRQVADNVPMGSGGIIMLPSRYVTSVDNLMVSTDDEQNYQLIEPSHYVWHEGGWLQRTDALTRDWYAMGYYYGNDQYYQPGGQPGFGAGLRSGMCRVSFWHGYTTVPADIKEVVFELASNSMAQAFGNIKQISTEGGYNLVFSRDLGLTLNPDQMNRLANYRIGMVA